MKLRGLLVVEGAAKSMAEVPQEVVEAAVALGYLEGLRRVIEQYKPAAAGRRLVDGVNQALESVSAFRRFSAEMVVLAGNGHMPECVRALHLHDAASGSAKQNGNLPDQQVELNRSALGVLEQVSEDARDDGWWAVYEKVMVGLMEAGHVAFDETKFRRIIVSMNRNGSKDTAGRREFLARWLVTQGRQEEARSVLEPVAEDVHSAPVQLDRARALLTELNQATVATVKLVPSPTTTGRPVHRGTTREKRARRRRGGTKSGSTDEPHPLARLRVRCARLAVCSFCTRRGNCCCPHQQLLQKSISFYWYFFVFGCFLV